MVCVRSSIIIERKNEINDLKTNEINDLKTNEINDLHTRLARLAAIIDSSIIVDG